MSQPIETMRQQLTEQALSLTAAAAHLGWSRRTLIRGISSKPQEPARTVGPRLPVSARIDERERAYWRRRLGQLNRKKRGT